MDMQFYPLWQALLLPIPFGFILTTEVFQLLPMILPQENLMGVVLVED
jgi:hypothetical protein